jgi:hypothetical protein
MYIGRSEYAPAKNVQRKRDYRSLYFLLYSLDSTTFVAFQDGTRLTSSSNQQSIVYLLMFCLTRVSLARGLAMSTRMTTRMIVSQVVHFVISMLIRSLSRWTVAIYAAVTCSMTVGNHKIADQFRAEFRRLRTPEARREWISRKQEENRVMREVSTYIWQHRTYLKKVPFQHRTLYCKWQDKVRHRKRLGLTSEWGIGRPEWWSRN